MKSFEKQLRKDRPTDGIDSVIVQFRYPVQRSAKRNFWLPASAVSVSLMVALGWFAIREAEASSLHAVIKAEEAAPQVTATWMAPDGTIQARGWKWGDRVRYELDEKSAGVTTRNHCWVVNAFDGRRTWYQSDASGVAVVETGRRPQISPPYFQKVAQMGGRLVSARRLADGTRSIELEAKSDPRAERMKILTDRQDRPVVIEYRRGSQLTAVERRDYDATINPDLFRFDPPGRLERYDVDQNRALLTQSTVRGYDAQTGLESNLLGVLQLRSGTLWIVFRDQPQFNADPIRLVELNGHAYTTNAMTGDLGSSERMLVKSKAAASMERASTLRSVQRPTTKVKILWVNGPKRSGNAAVRLTFTLKTAKGSVVTFRNVVPIRSNVGEEIRLSSSAANAPAW